MSKAYDPPEQFLFRKKESVPFTKFLYDGDTGKVLGRTGLSWAKICLFYTVFYGVLVALVVVCMWVFFQTLDPRTPKWQLTESRIGDNPGLGFRPLPPDDQAESTLIWFKAANDDSEKKNYQYWIDSLKEFLDVYETPGSAPSKGETIYSCRYDNPPPKGRVCIVDVKSWKPCTRENNFNYHKSSPCIFLKLNKIYGWIPEYYNTTDDLPEDMPKDLVTYITNKSNQTAELNTIWVSCEGENPADIENIGPIKYYPTRGFPGYYYPYENSEGYLSPLIAIHLERPKTGVLINIECKAWAKNIKHDRHDRLGSVHFELMID